MATNPADIRQLIAQIYAQESRRVLATLIRLLHDFELAEEALQEAFAAALAQWPSQGLPANPRAWLVSAGRFKAIDRVRRRVRFDASVAALASQLALEQAEDQAQDATGDEQELEDDQLRLIFTCCHPALNQEAQVALTLREVCGLTTEAIARAFLLPTPTVAQRIVRAKNKIRDAAIPYQVPATDELPERLESVLRVIYLVFNEGYSGTIDEEARRSLCDEAIRLGRLLRALLPATEVIGLLALMLLQSSRRDARTSANGDLILLADQDRSLWQHDQIAEGCALVETALAAAPPGPYALQAAIAAVHAEATSAAATDWTQIAGLYDVLLRIEPSPVVALNRAVAVAMRDGPGAGLALIEPLLGDPPLTDYPLAHAARADLCRRLGRLEEARVSYLQALTLTQSSADRRFLEKRLAELAG